MLIRPVIFVGSIGLLGLIANVSLGAVITPVSAFASSYYNTSLSPTQAINNAGLDISAGNVLTYTHDVRGDGFGTWITGQGQGGGGSSAPTTQNQYIVFNLGANYDLTSAYIWQLVQGTLLDRGLKDFRLLASSAAPISGQASNPPANYDLTGFTEILAPSVLNIGTLNSGQPVRPTAQKFSLTNANNVRQIYLDVNSAHSGMANSYVGLSEIKFEGTLSPVVAHRWTNAAGGMWHTSGNWSPSSVPATDQNVVFDLDSTYTVTLNRNTTINNLDVSAGHVTIDPQSNILRPNTINISSGGKLTVPAMVHTAGAAGQVFYLGLLNLTDGTLEVAGGAFRPRSAPFTASGLTYTAWTLSGQIATSARPTVELTNGAYNIGTTSADGEGAIVIGINGGRGGVLIDGNNSILRSAAINGSAGQLAVGFGGTTLNGTYHASDGELHVSNGGTARGQYDVYIGRNGGKGVAVVDGVNSSLISVNSSLFVGANRHSSAGVPADGTLTIRNGGRATGTNIVIGYNGAAGRLTLTGEGSSLATTSDTGGLAIGFNEFGQSAPANAHLVVTDKATATVSGNLLVGRASGATGTLDILRGGQVHTTAAVNYSAIGYHGNGTVNIDGAGSQLTSVSNTFYVGYGVPGTADLNITNGGELRVSQLAQIGAAGGIGRVVVGKSDGSDTGTSVLSAASLDLGTGNSPDGTLTVYRQGFVDVSGRFRSPAQWGIGLHLHGGTIKAGSFSIDTASMLNWTSGTLWLDGGTASFGSTNNTFVVPSDGTLQGSGTINRAVRVEGTISPGNEDSIATLAMRNLTLGTSNTTGLLAANIDLGDSSADLLNVTGTVNLTNAALALSLLDLDSADLTMPQTYLLIQNDSNDAVIGSFTSVLGLSSLVQYSLDYAFLGQALNGTGTGNDVAITFTAVPEPTTMIAPLIAGLSLLSRRRRYRN